MSEVLVNVGEVDSLVIFEIVTKGYTLIPISNRYLKRQFLSSEPLVGKLPYQ